MTVQPAIRAEHLTRRFGDRTAFEDLTFEVAAGEIFGFLGPNGAGKTTTVRVLATILGATSGTAEVAGLPITADTGPEIRRRISVMPETPGLYLKLSLRENLEFFAGLYGLPSAGVAARIGEVLAAVGLADRADELAGSLSKGLRQRAALARALLPDPSVVFLDEPTSGLDPAAAVEVRGLIESLRTRGHTVFLTTHRLEEAERLCDRVAILRTRVLAIGPPDELRRRFFGLALEVRLGAPLTNPAVLFEPIKNVAGWSAGGVPGSYLLQVSSRDGAAPEVARAVVSAGADLLHLAEVEHSLEDVYLQLTEAPS